MNPDDEITIRVDKHAWHFALCVVDQEIERLNELRPHEDEQLQYAIDFKAQLEAATLTAR